MSLFTLSPSTHPLLCSGQPGSPDNNEAKKSRESAGLDLSFKRDDDDQETDTERDEANTNMEEERNEDSDDGNSVSKQSYQGQGGRSRRKPAAPQWVNPFMSGDQETETKEENSGDSRTINGVCVVNFPGPRDNGDMVSKAGE